jgi:hypothetical protein
VNTNSMTLHCANHHGYLTNNSLNGMKLPVLDTGREEE